MPADRAKDLRILLIKGDLLRRYPDALIYAAKAKWSTNPSGQPVAPAVVDDAHPPSLPVLRVDPGFGVTLLGFNLPDAAGVAAPPGDAGYFFVIQEHPTEPRFGLDVSSRLHLAEGACADTDGGRYGAGQDTGRRSCRGLGQERGASSVHHAAEAVSSRDPRALLAQVEETTGRDQDRPPAGALPRAPRDALRHP
jgi:hypothetical protein